MLNNNDHASSQTLLEQMQKMAAELSSLNQRLSNQEKLITSQQQLISKQQQDIDLLLSLLPSNTRAMLKNKTNGNSASSIAHSNQNSTAKTKSSKVKSYPANFLLLLGIALIVGMNLFFSLPKEAHSRLIVNPQGYLEQFGAILVPSSTTITGTLSNTNARLGLVATGNPSLDFGALPIFDTGAYASGSGYGVYATSNSSQGYGVYASNTAASGLGSSYAIYGFSQKGTGLGGSSSGAGQGVYGTSSSGAGVFGEGFNGSGVLATSTLGAPLTIVAGNTPTTGSRQFGDLYVDNSGKLYIWAKSDDGMTSNWRRLQFAT